MRSLFWKIFAAVWFANIVIMVGTTHTVLMMTRMEAREERVRKEARAVAEEILRDPGRHQAMWVDPWRAEPNQRYEYDFVSGELRPLPPFLFDAEIQILAPNGRIIFGPKSTDLRKVSDNTVEFTVIGGDQKTYRVLALPPEEPIFVMEELARRMQSVSMLVILVVSGLVSFLLTALITRPVKRLGKHARHLAAGNLDARVEGKLIEREDEIGDLAREFNLMADRLSSLIHSKQQLLHDVSHELRAPLARLQTAAAITQQKSGDEPIPTIARIEQECSRMDALIQEILNLARLEQTEIPLEAVDLAQLLESLVEDVRYEYAEHPLQLQLPERHKRIQADAELLRRALENILRNACKHTPSGTAIDLQLHYSRHWAEITIRDHGPGVSEEDIELLFAPFYRAGKQMHTEGFGLGLSIAARAVDRHRGHISASNHPEGGLQITLQLPR